METRWSAFALASRRHIRLRNWLSPSSGQLLAIAFSTVSVSLISAQTGKAVHRIHSSAFPKAIICCLGWGVNVTYRNEPRTVGTTANLDELFNRGPQAQPSNIPLDLPTELAFLDIEGILPRLSALPAGGKECVYQETTRHTPALTNSFPETNSSVQGRH